MRWIGGRRSGPESPANGGVPPQAGARRAPATVEVPPPADDIWSAAHSRVAQLVEQPAVNRRVAGSSPASGALEVSLPQGVPSPAAARTAHYLQSRTLQTAGCSRMPQGPLAPGPRRPGSDVHPKRGQSRPTKLDQGLP